MINGKKILALIQARCSSTRLPLKHFRYIGNKRLIDYVVDRLKEIGEIDEIVISTTNDETDKPFIEYAHEKGIGVSCFNGDINDVIGRHTSVVKKSECEYFVVISGDCPLINTEYIRSALYKLSGGYNAVRVENWPDYMTEGIEVFDRHAIFTIDAHSELPHEREHFFYILEKKILGVKVGYIRLTELFKGRDYRISVDNMADLKFMNEILKRLNNEGKDFSIHNALGLLRSCPELSKINGHIGQKGINTKTYRILIKTEASRSKGLGHIRRITELGRFLNENLNNGVFYAINYDKEAVGFLERKGYIYDYCIAETEDELINGINTYNADILIIDIQELSENHPYNIERIRQKTKIKRVIVMDKYFDSGYIDLFILQGMQGKAVLEKISGKKDALYGLEAVIINEDIKKIYSDNREKSLKNNYVTISFGGTDIHNLTTRIVEVINSLQLEKVYTYRIVVGPYFSHMERLKQALETFRYAYEVIKNPDDIAEVFAESEICIIYHGVTFYECKYLEAATIDIAPGEVNVSELEELEKIGLTHGIGSYDDIDAFKLQHYLNNPQLLAVKKQYKIGDMKLISERILDTESNKNCQDYK